jgi:hypothetical protein
MKIVKKRILSCAIAAIGAASLSGAVHAQVYAVSYGNIFNLNITSTDENDLGAPFYIPLADFTDFTAASATTALLNGAGDPAFPSNSEILGEATNALPSYGLSSIFPVPGGAPADNAMTPLGQQAGANYARGDAQVPTTAIEQPVIAGPITPTFQSTQAWNIAETYVDANGFANASAVNSSETGFNTTITLGGPSRLVFNFEADPYLYVEMNAAAAGGSANANIDVTITVTSGGGTVFEWSPNGAPGGITGGVESLDPASLNLSREVTAPGASSEYDPTGDASSGTSAPATSLTYSARTNDLPAGVYTLSVDTLGNVNVLTALAAVNYDYGDNPDGSGGTGTGDYQTTEANGGAQHQIAGPFMGSCVDADDGTLQNVSADDDDSTAGTEVGTCAGGDEDGVSLPITVMAGNSYNLQISMPGSGSNEDCDVDGWMDFNADGDFNDSGEYIIASQTLSQSSGTNVLNFAVPGSAVEGPLYSRFRCSRDGGLGPNGLVDNGEVEDYLLSIVPPGEEVEVPTIGLWGLGLLSLMVTSIVALRRKHLTAA